MDKRVFAFLKSYSSDPLRINKLLVSAYLKALKIDIKKNKLLLSFLIEEEDEEYKYLEHFLNLYKFANLEDLIESFEFVISPSDKIVNGAVYTPDYIRTYIVKECIEKSSQKINDLITGDLSCGCGGFLLTLAKHIHDNTNKDFFSIYKDNIFGIDITEYSVTRCKILLTLLAVENGEDLEEFSFNLVVENSLTYNWAENFQSIKRKSGFDIIVGNPPYVTSRNMDNETLSLMSKWEVTKSGHPDLYIPFFQIGYENLNSLGILGYITVNTFMKSINGRALRQYFSRNKVNLKIINFGGEQIFKDRNTYTCLCFLTSSAGSVFYLRITSDKINQVTNNSFLKYEYKDLNDIEGWNLVSTDVLNDFISSVESTGKPFKSLFSTKNGIATLSNNVYKFKPFNEDSKFYYFKNNNKIYSVEKIICRDIVNANKLKIDSDLQTTREKIIFPYTRIDGLLKIIPEADFSNKYPRCFEYLEKHKGILSKRDKGNREYETWFAYGRKQSMDINAYKLFFPHICEKPSFVISTEKDLLFYNGIAVVSDSLEELHILKKILESDLFFKYIKSTTKDYSSGYISMSKNYIKNFGIYDLTLDDKNKLLNLENPNEFLNYLYKVSINLQN